MISVDSSVVREYFEMNGFLVRSLPLLPLPARSKRSEAVIRLMIYNPAFKAENRKPNPLLFASELPLVQRALVTVKSQHSPKISAGTVRSSAEIAKFLQKEVCKQADTLFAVDKRETEHMEHFLKILVIPSLPTHEPHKSKSVEILNKAGIDAILSFRSMLQAIVGKVEMNLSCPRSDLLHTVQLLKIYDMIKSPQLELFSGKQ